MRPLVNPREDTCFTLLCGTDYLRVTFTLDLSSSVDLRQCIFGGS